MAHKLSNAFVGSLKADPSRKSGQVFTDPMGGLQIWVSTNGTKTWRFSYRPKGKNPVTLTLGRFPEMDAETARFKALACQGERDDGDPKKLVDTRARISTIAEILYAHADVLEARSPATGRSVRKRYQRLVRVYGDAEIHEFGEALKAYVDFQYSSDKQQGAARGLISYVSAAFTRAEDPMNGLVLPRDHVNPIKGLVSHIPWLMETKAGTWKVSFEEADLTKLIDAITLAQAQPSLHLPGLFALELLLLTGARPNEICSLRDSEITVRGGVTRIIKDRHKTWRKTGRPREILLMGEAVEVLERARAWRDKRFPTESNDSWIFPAKPSQPKKHKLRTGHINNLWNYAAKVSKLSGVKFIPYNLRSSYINVALDNPPPGMDFFAWLERVAENVGHTNVQTTLGFYRKQRDEKLIEAAKHTAGVFKSFRTVANNPAT